MVLEIADFKVKPGAEDAFVETVRDNIGLVAQTAGFRSARLTRGIESTSRFVLLIEWDSLTAHTVGFRESERFPAWRAAIGPYFDGDPYVEHATDVLSSTDVLRTP